MFDRSKAHEDFLEWWFWHNGQRTNVGQYPNKYEAADEFRNRYGYYPILEEATNSPEG